MINETIGKAYKVLEGKEISQEEALLLAKIEGEDILDLVSLANKVKNRFASEIHKCTIMNAKSGMCSENCSYCAQSSHNHAETEVYDLKDKDSILDAARVSYGNGVRNFGIVTSGYGFKKINKDFQNILDAVDAIHNEMPDMGVCASLGILSEETANALADHGIRHYNNNLQVNPEKYAELIATTHTVEERIKTIRLLKKAGIKCCTGGILGLGENMEDRVKLAFTLKELDVDVIPLNVLIPIKGTPMENRPFIPAAEVAKTFALFRLINPTKDIKFAAGRETRMNDWQGFLMLAGANGFLTGGYLTTRGRDTQMDLRLENDLEGFAYSMQEADGHLVNLVF